MPSIPGHRSSSRSSGFAGWRDSGRIVNVSTSYTLGKPDPQLIAYAMTKAAIDVFTATLAKELAPAG